MKCIMNIFRTMKWYATSEEEAKLYYQLADAILECRMIGNFGRPLLTVYQAMKRWHGRVAMRRSKLNGASVKFCCWCEALSLSASLFRFMEQLSGDLGLLQKIVFHSWSRRKLSWCFAFFKSIAIILALLGEIMTSRVNMQALKRCKQARCKAKRCCNIPTLKAALRTSFALIFRCCCDLYVYLKWIPGYEPYPPLTFLCGFISGLIGVGLVWLDVRYRAEYMPLCSCIESCEDESGSSKVSQISLNAIPEE